MLDIFRVLLLPTLAALFYERHDLVVENLLLRHQLYVALRSRPRPHLNPGDRFFWLMVRRLYPAWRLHLVLVRPETVLDWHRRGWGLFWRWRSGTHRHLIPLSKRHLRAILSEFVDYYNHDRPHRSLGLQPPAPRPRNQQDGIIVRPVLGGLHHVYERAA